MNAGTEKESVRSLLFFGKDFMIGSRVEGVARNHSLTFLRADKKESLQSIEPPPRIVLFDIASTGDTLSEMVAGLKKTYPDTSLVGLAFHTDEASLQKGKESGLHTLITRSHLVDGLNRILEKRQ
ncbi:MAG: hypothetical protein M0Z37_08720 [Nitrospiraceae bacterium]|jgi:DNA-binding NarL/FixJ family response regulator|nr:hypothetical protein [Nitrospiraceae bacterium]